jgi:hypothetical protein
MYWTELYNHFRVVGGFIFYALVIVILIILVIKDRRD